MKVKIGDEAFGYLVHQRGALWDLAGDRPAWEAAYRKALACDYHAIAPHLPEIEAPRILDIGSGMGGIDLLIWEHYGHEGRFTLLDAEDGGAEPVAHDRPFGSTLAAERFLAANGMGNVATIEGAPQMIGPFDVILSIRAWCFHIEPRAYLEPAIGSSAPGATFIIDVRRHKPSWRRELVERLGQPEIAHSTAKSDLLVFRL